ncbi:MAG: hypothetical protein K2M85_09275 [Paramuribaculum sp.]|nr:hypothetical protein [Paramuribaculum sp.]
MKRKLSVQIRNEWRANLWLAAELLIVSMVMWYVLVTVFSTLWLRTGSPGYDITGVWLVGYNVVDEEARDFDASRGDEESLRDDMEELLRRLREAPGVKAQAVSSNAIPYNYNRNGYTSTLIRTDGSGEMLQKFFVQKFVSPNYIVVMDIHGYNGETPEELAEFMREKHGRLISANAFENQDVVKYNTPDIIGQDWEIMYDDSTTSPLKVIPFQQRNDYEPARDATIFQFNLLDERPWYPRNGYEITVRIDPEKEKEFVAWVNEKTGGYLSVGNVYVNDLTSIDSIRHLNQANIRELVHNRLAIVAFLMMSIFLGLLGAFWFRTQSRVGEIAIRKVNGATSAMIFRRLMGEGLLILTAVTPIALLGDWVLVRLDLVVYLFTDAAPLWQYATCAVITYLLIALAVVLGIWFPGRKAMAVDPARALADE